MAMTTILFDKKVTSANTTYLDMSDQDKAHIYSKCMSISTYMDELSIHKGKGLKDLMGWWNKPQKSLPFSKNAGVRNSPRSFIGGIYNNGVEGNQRDISEVQSEHLANIINSFESIRDYVESDLKLDLQPNADKTGIIFIENLWEIKP
jgi:hypothetical protein